MRIVIKRITNPDTRLRTVAMSTKLSTRRRVLQGIGAGGTAALLGTSSVGATNDETVDHGNNEDDVDPEYEDFAALRFGHLSPDTPEVDIYVGKTADLNPTVGGLAYSQFGPGPNDAYLQVPPGSYNAAVAPAGTTDPAIDVDEIELEGGVRYTVLAVGTLADLTAEDEDTPDSALQPLVLVDALDTNAATPEADQSEIRFAHTSPDAGEVDVLVNGDPLLENVGFGDASDYVQVDPGDYDVSVEADGEEVLAVTRTLRVGTRITAYVVGFAAPPASEDDEEDEQDRALAVVTSLDGNYPLASDVLTR